MHARYALALHCDLFLHSYSHTLTITCTCCYDEIKGTQDLKMYSHADSLSELVCVTIAYSTDCKTYLFCHSTCHVRTEW